MWDNCCSREVGTAGGGDAEKRRQLLQHRPHREASAAEVEDTLKVEVNDAHGPAVLSTFWTPPLLGGRRHRTYLSLLMSLRYEQLLRAKLLKC